MYFHIILIAYVVVAISSASLLVDPCSSDSGPCDINATCTSYPGEYTCHCNDGFIGNGYILTEGCTDIDECAAESDNCDDSSTTCRNTDGSYECDCIDGYTRVDEYSCESDTDCANLVDRNVHCAIWADLGECEVNPDYMLGNCAASCHGCEDPCLQLPDVTPWCSGWAFTGECVANPAYMNIDCQTSCNTCGTSPPLCIEDADFDTNSCVYWAHHQGQCEANPVYMYSFCQTSCDKCGNGPLVVFVPLGNACRAAWAGGEAAMTAFCDTLPWWLVHACKLVVGLAEDACEEFCSWFD